MEKEITNVTLKHWKIPTCDMYDTVLCMIKTAWSSIKTDRVSLSLWIHHRNFKLIETRLPQPVPHFYLAMSATWRRRKIPRVLFVLARSLCTYVRVLRGRIMSMCTFVLRLWHCTPHQFSCIATLVNSCLLEFSIKVQSFLCAADLNLIQEIDIVLESQMFPTTWVNGSQSLLGWYCTLTNVCTSWMRYPTTNSAFRTWYHNFQRLMHDDNAIY